MKDTLTKYKDIFYYNTSDEIGNLEEIQSIVKNNLIEKGWTSKLNAHVESLFNSYSSPNKYIQIQPVKFYQLTNPDAGEGNIIGEYYAIRFTIDDYWEFKRLNQWQALLYCKILSIEILENENSDPISVDQFVADQKPGYEIFKTDSIDEYKQYRTILCKLFEVPEIYYTEYSGNIYICHENDQWYFSTEDHIENTTTDCYSGMIATGSFYDGCTLSFDLENENVCIYYIKDYTRIMYHQFNYDSADISSSSGTHILTGSIVVPVSQLGDSIKLTISEGLDDGTEYFVLENNNIKPGGYTYHSDNLTIDYKIECSWIGGSFRHAIFKSIELSDIVPAGDRDPFGYKYSFGSYDLTNSSPSLIPASGLITKIESYLNIYSNA